MVNTMLLDLIYGGAGTGKTERCINLIERTLKKNPGHNAVVTVPDQYSYMMEKRIVGHFGGTGLNNIEVITFSQFFRRYLINKDSRLLPSGKHMLLCRAAKAACGEDSIFARSVDKDGFAGKMSELISEMKHYLITPEMLKEAAGEDSDMFSEKLRAVSDIYMEYNKLLEKGFEDSEDDFLRFAGFIQDSGAFKNTHIWFDGFSDFLPQHYKVIRAFLAHARSVHVTVCMPAGKKDGVFLTPAATAEKLKAICKELGARLYEQECGDKCYTMQSEELLHLNENWDNKNNQFNEKTKDISLFCARDLYSETEHAAKNIIKEVKNGASFGGIAVMCADTDRYAHLIEAVFGDYNIPYFIDSDMSVSDHPIILTVLGIFDIIEENWSYESVFRYLRTGFIYEDKDGDAKAHDREKIDRLENYVLRHGIRGKSRWMSEWTKESSGIFDSVLGERKTVIEDVEEINDTRRRVCAPFVSFYEKASGRRTVRELSEALFGFLCDIKLYQGINKEVEHLNKIGMRDAAERMKEIWNLLMEVINQAVVTMGEEYSSKEEFAKLIKEGLSKSAMKIIPPGPDAVCVGAADRNSSARPEILMFLGAVSGTMPQEVQNKSIFTDRDRKALEEKGIETAGTSLEKTERENFKFYRAVTSACKKLYFSYPTSNSDGEAQQPSAFFKTLHAMFPKLDISDDLMEQKPQEINNSKEAYLYIMRAVADKSMRENARMLARHYRDSAYLKEKMPMAKFAAEYKKKQPQITMESARLLYNDYHRYSVSRLNDYAACPFGYYIKNGLKAQEQEVWQIQKFDIGSLLHWAVCEYCREVDGGAESIEETKKRWHELSDEKSNAIIERITEEITERTIRGLKRDREKIAYLIGRMKKILIRSVDIVRLSFTKGEYSAVCYEEKFKIDIDWNGKSTGINGTIDRVDVAQDYENGTVSLRVIDYKSGSKKFDIVSVSNKEDMQLVVYAIAATELYKKGALGHAEKGLKPSVKGILYNKLRNDTVACSEGELADVDGVIRKSMRLDGLVIADEGDEVSTAIKMDRDLENGGASSYLKLKVNSKGDALNKNESSYTTSDRFKILTDYVKKTVVSLDEEIFSGNIDIMPAGGKKKACSYCKYKEICLYDVRLDGEKKEITGADNAWEYMENEVYGKKEGEHAEEGMDK